MNSKLAEFAQKSKILSFDIFDTLLVRTYTKASDVFLHLETLYKKEGFAKARIEAEFKACEKFNKIIQNLTYDEIYLCLDENFQSLKEKEKELELANLYADPCMLTFLRKMKQLGKIIILSSDMYHSSEFIKELLDKNHIEYDKLYLSSALQKSKADCSLYEFMIDDLKVRAEEILHIGDNYEADYKNALKVGLKAFYKKRPLDEFLEHFDKIKLFYEQNKNLTAFVSLGLLLRKWLESGKKLQNYWEIFGYFYAGALCYGLTKFIYDEAAKEDLREFIFIARDGYVIQKVFDFLVKTYKKDIKTAYVYAPRSINLAINLDLENEVPWDSKASSLIDLYKDEIEAFQNVDLSAMSESEKLRLVEENKESLNELSFKLKQNYQSYIDNFCFKEKRIGLFDTATYEFSAVKLMQRFLQNTTILSYYEHIVPNEKLKDKFIAKQYHSGNSSFMIEFLITAPELPIKSLNDKGEFVRIDNTHEQIKAKIYKDIAQAEFEFSRDLISIFKDFEVKMQSQTAMNLIDTFTQNLNDEDFEAFKDLYQSSSISHSLTSYVPLLQRQERNNLIGAANRIKNQLSYRLGAEILQAKNPVKALMLPFRLYMIYKNHRFEKAVYNVLIKLSPNLKLPPLQEYADYNEALKIKDHLSYKLGNAMLKNPLSFILKFPLIVASHRKKR